MSEVWRPRVRGPEWRVSERGVSLGEAEPHRTVAWDDLEHVEAAVPNPHAGTVTLRIPGGKNELRLARRWDNRAPTSGFTATVRSNLPDRLRTESVDEALRDLWGFARSVELGATTQCIRCGGSLVRASAAALDGSFRTVEATLHDVDRRVCEQCSTPHLLDEDQPGELLFPISEKMDQPDVNWSDGVQGAIRLSGFRSRQRGDVRVRVTGSNAMQPTVTDCYLAVLHALCNETLPT